MPQKSEITLERRNLWFNLLEDYSKTIQDDRNN